MASIGTLRIQIAQTKKFRKYNNRYRLSKYLLKLKDQNIDDVILEASSHGLNNIVLMD